METEPTRHAGASSRRDRQNQVREMEAQLRHITKVADIVTGCEAKADTTGRVILTADGCTASSLIQDAGIKIFFVWKQERVSADACHKRLEKRPTPT